MATGVIQTRTYVGPRAVGSTWLECTICGRPFPKQEMAPYRDRDTGKVIKGSWVCKQACNDKLPLHDKHLAEYEADPREGAWDNFLE